MILRRSPLAGIFLFTLILTLSFPQVNALASSDRAKAYDDDPITRFRLYKRFVEDAAIPKKGWMGGGMDQQYWDSKLGKWAAQLGGGITEMTMMENLAIGCKYLLGTIEWQDFTDLAARNGVMLDIHHSLDFYTDFMGISDIDVWIKYQFKLDNGLVITPGILANIPAAKAEFPMEGGWDIEGFLSARKDFKYLTLVGHLGGKAHSGFDIAFKYDRLYRINGVTRLDPNEDKRFEFSVDGKIAFLCGVGMIIPWSEKAAFITEINYMGPTHEDGSDFFQLMFGPEIVIFGYRSLRIAYGVSLSDNGTPTGEMLFGGRAIF